MVPQDAKSVVAHKLKGRRAPTDSCASDMRQPVGRNVKRSRQGKGLTQEQVAGLSGFSAWSRAAATIVTSYELAKVLGVIHIDLLSPE
jgi:hypothetical protein